MQLFLALMIFGNLASAQTSEIQWTPSHTREFLKELDARGDLEDFKSILQPETVVLLDWYQNQDDTLIDGKPSAANVLAAAGVAFVTGAVAAGVDYLWDKYVGNGSKDLIWDEDLFDLVIPEPDLWPRTMEHIKPGSMDYVGQADHVGNPAYPLEFVVETAKKGAYPTHLEQLKKRVEATHYTAGPYFGDGFNTSFDLDWSNGTRQYSVVMGHTQKPATFVFVGGPIKN